MPSNGVNGTPRPTDDLNRRGERIGELVGRIDAVADPAARELLHECMEAVLAFYGEGLGRILEIVKGEGPEGLAVFSALARDDVVRGFLLIHGLHPVDQQTRLREALAKVRPYLQSHGGDVELLSLRDDVARLRLIGHCETCPSSTVTLELAVRHAIEEACPDLLGFEVAGVPTDRASGAGRAADRVQTDWQVIEGVLRLADGELRHVRASGVTLVICKVAGELYAFRDRCPACNTPLHLGIVTGATLQCGTGHRYDVSRAGRDLAGTEGHLDPFPLLVEDGAVRVALAGSTLDAANGSLPVSA